MGILVLLGVICSIHAAYAATHSLRYFYTATSGVPNFPEFVTVGMVDDEPFTYYDSVIRRETPRQDWMAKSVDDGYWDRNTQVSFGAEQTFKADIEIAKQRFNQSGGVHVVQNMYGCEWDEETGATDGFYRDGYDGEDFIAFDMKNMRWIAPTPQGFVTKNKWDNDRADLEQTKNYLTQICIDWLKKYVNYGRSTLERRVPPEVSLFQKDSSSPVVCHATGFFPRGIMVTWQRDGEEVQEDVEQGETLPNGDGTFQITSRLLKPEDTHTYTCTVQHKSLEKDIIKTHSFSSGPPMGIIIGCVVGVLIVTLAVIGVVMWKKRSTGYGKTSTSDTNSEASDSKGSIDSGHSDTDTESRHSNGSSESINSDSSNDSNDSGKPLMKKNT